MAQDIVAPPMEPTEDSARAESWVSSASVGQTKKPLPQEHHKLEVTDWGGVVIALPFLLAIIAFVYYVICFSGRNG